MDLASEALEKKRDKSKTIKVKQTLRVRAQASCVKMTQDTREVTFIASVKLVRSLFMQALSLLCIDLQIELKMMSL